MITALFLPEVNLYIVYSYIVYCYGNMLRLYYKVIFYDTLVLMCVFSFQRKKKNTSCIRLCTFLNRIYLFLYFWLTFGVLVYHDIFFNKNGLKV